MLFKRTTKGYTGEIAEATDEHGQRENSSRSVGVAIPASAILSIEKLLSPPLLVGKHLRLLVLKDILIPNAMLGITDEPRKRPCHTLPPLCSSGP